MPGTPPTRFVYLGPEGTFTEQALRTIPAAEHGIRTPARSVPEALEAVRAGEADAALVPLENSVGGAVPVTLDELATGSPLVITREVVLPVEFQLAASRLIPLAQIRTVAAHPQASAQCRNWLLANMPDAVVVDVLSNAAAAISAAAGEHDAAICAPIGVPRNGLTVLADKIADRADAVTRFALLSRPAAPAAPTGDDVTSLAVSIRARPGGCAARGADRAGGTRHQPEPHRVPADRRAARHLRVLPGLHRARRRAAAGRGAAGPAADLRRGAVPGQLPPAPLVDGRGRGAAPDHGRPVRRGLRRLGRPGWPASAPATPA